MDNLNSLRLCTEKTLSTKDKIILKETFNIENFEIKETYNNMEDSIKKCKCKNKHNQYLDGVSDHIHKFNNSLINLYVNDKKTEEDYSKEVENSTSPIYGTEGGLSSIYRTYNNNIRIPVVLNNADSLQLLTPNIRVNNENDEEFIWDENNTYQLLQFHNNNKNIYYMSKLIGTSQHNIRKKLNELGIGIIEKFVDIYNKPTSKKRTKYYLSSNNNNNTDINWYNTDNIFRLINLVNKGSNIQEIALVFGTTENIITKQLKNIGLVIENFDNTRNNLLYKLRYYINNNIIILKDPSLNLIDSIMNRQFYTKKFTISFDNPKDIIWTDLSSLETMRDENYNLIPIDPIEYEIRKLNPIEAIKKVVKERIEPFVNITFEFIEESSNIDEAVIRIGFNPKEGCWSLLGIDHFFSLETKTLNFGWLDSGTIMHEFGHVLGMIHEHQVPVGKTIKWNEPLVYKWAEQTHGWNRETTYTNIIKKYEKNQLNVTNFEPKSIMLYFFPAVLTLDNIGAHQNMRLAVEDIKFFISIVPGKTINYIKFFKDNYNEDIKDISIKSENNENIDINNNENIDINNNENRIKLFLILLISILIYKIIKKLYK